MSDKRKLVAVLACRNNGSRLYAKPLQNLDANDGTKVIDNIINCLKNLPSISAVILAISNRIENYIFEEIAELHNLIYVKGDDTDVLQRLILAGQKGSATDIFRVTSESPFVNYNYIEKAWNEHLNSMNDATFLDDVVDGTGFEILTLQSLKRSHSEGDSKHKSELCSLFIRENPNIFKTAKVNFDSALTRPDLRLTVDYPEDLIVCREVYSEFKNKAPFIEIGEIIWYLDKNPYLIKLISRFTEQGYSKMYI